MTVTPYIEGLVCGVFILFGCIYLGDCIKDAARIFRGTKD